MKKLAVLSIALLMLTTLVFAEVMVEPKVAFSGSGTLTWGIDLNTPASNGFLNESSANLTVTLVAKSTETKGGAEGETVFGYIGLKDMSLIFNSDSNFSVGDDDDATLTLSALDLDGDPTTDSYVVTYPDDADTVSVMSDVLVAPSIEAYVQLGPAKWFIYSAPDMAIDYAGVLEDDTDDDYWAEGDESNGIATDGTGDFGSGATGVEIAAGPATIDALVSSSKDWDDDTATATTYGAALKAAVTAGPVTIKAGGGYDFGASSIDFGGSVGLTAGPVAVSAGFDGVSAGALTYELAGGVTLTLPDVVTLTANAAFGDVWNLDAEVGATLKAVPSLDFAALLGLWNITSGLSWGVNVNTGYKIAMGETNYVKPGVNAFISTLNGGTLRITLIGTVEAVLISNTTFTLTYKATDLTGAIGAANIGVITFATKVAY